jgi:enoyl-CoA hydratase
MDLASFASGESMDLSGDGQAAFAAFQRFLDGDVRVPVVGAANATAVAGGLELLLGCDVVVASRDARFGLPEVKRGLIAAGGGLFTSARIPMAFALELTLTGDLVDASRAAAIGLVNHAVAPDDVLDTAMGIAERIAANAPLSLEATKEVVRLAARDMARARERFAHWQPIVFASEDATEGATAFLEKRDAVWRGR